MRVAAALIAVLVGLTLGSLDAVAGPDATTDEPATAVLDAVEPGHSELVIFWGDGCPHCAAEWEFLATLTPEFPDLEIAGYEVWYSKANQIRFVNTMRAIGEEASAVPTTLFGDHIWVGFGPEIEQQIRAAVEAAFTEAATPIEPAAEALTLPILGTVDAGRTSLVVGTVVIGFVDGFNPCSLWALSMLLALVLRTGSRKRVLMVGTVFLTVTAALYGLYIAGLYSALQFVSHATWIRTLLALVALAFGLVNLKDYWWFRRGPSLTISDKAKPRLYRRMRAVSTDGRSLAAVLGGTVLLAVGVSLLETPCTAGYPLLWADLLSAQGVATATAVGLFAIYMLVFLLDELAVFGTAVVAMRVTKLEEHHGRFLKLISGMLMVVLAGVLVTAPRLMETVSGAVLTFAIAAGATGVVLASERFRHRERPRQTSKTA